MEKFMSIVTVEIDLPKNVFAVHRVDATGKPVLIRAENANFNFHRMVRTSRTPK